MAVTVPMLRIKLSNFAGIKSTSCISLCCAQRIRLATYLDMGTFSSIPSFVKQRNKEASQSLQVPGASTSNGPTTYGHIYSPQTMPQNPLTSSPYLLLPNPLWGLEMPKHGSLSANCRGTLQPTGRYSYKVELSYQPSSPPSCSRCQRSLSCSKEDGEERYSCSSKRHSSRKARRARSYSPNPPPLTVSTVKTPRYYPLPSVETIESCSDASSDSSHELPPIYHPPAFRIPSPLPSSSYPSHYCTPPPAVSVIGSSTVSAVSAPPNSSYQPHNPLIAREQYSHGSSNSNSLLSSINLHSSGPKSSHRPSRRGQ